jgi:hypothetical protein
MDTAYSVTPDGPQVRRRMMRSDWITLLETTN